MLDYLIQWMHLYIIHLGAIICLLFTLDLYVKGLPQTKDLPNMFKTAIILAGVLALISSHSHVHFLNYLGKK